MKCLSGKYCEKNHSHSYPQWQITLAVNDCVSACCSYFKNSKEAVLLPSWHITFRFIFLILSLVLYNFSQFIRHTSWRGTKIRFDPGFFPGQ